MKSARMSASTCGRQKSSPASSKLASKASQAARLALVALATLSLTLQEACCEPAKEFDWADLGVSLTNSKSLIGGSSPSANNLRILVSPQRRMTKNYEFEYANSSQPQSDTTSYLLPGPGSSYAAPGSSHSSAYSALSASIASLKNRLNARGVSLGSLNDNNGSNAPYSSVPNAYNGADNSAQQQHQQQSQQQAPQPTYLSLTNQQEQHSSAGASGYGVSSSHGQNNDNKTIVLAIPAKINFLTDARSSKSQAQQQLQQHQQPQQQHQHQQQQQQLTVIQPTSGQAVSLPGDYSSKQLGYVAGGHDGSLGEQAAQLVGATNGAAEQHEHQQYVIVNSAPGASQESGAPQLVASQLGASQAGAQPGSLYTNLYQPSSVMQPAAVSPHGSYAVKYIPAYQHAQAAGPQAHLESAGGHPLESVAKQTRYSTTCLDTCNPMDPRWRKYSMSKYKYCCSRSAQFSDEQPPLVEKLGNNEASYKYADDAYYNYLYRRARGRRSSKRQHRSSRYRYSAPPASSLADEEGAGSSELESERGAPRQAPSRGSYGAGFDSVAPYSKYYKSRQQQQQQLDEAAAAGSDSASLGGPLGNKYAKERAYRSGRSSRDFDSQEHGGAEQPADEEAGGAELAGRPAPQSLGYGASGDYSSVVSGRYSSSAADDEETPQRPQSYEPESFEPEPPAHSSGKGYAADYSATDSSLASNEQQNSSQLGDAENQEPETTTSYNKKSSESAAGSSSGGARRRKASKQGKTSRKLLRDSFGRYLKKNRKSPRANLSKLEQQQLPTSSQYNATDFDAAQPNLEQYHSSSAAEASTPTDDEQMTGAGYQKDSPASQEAAEVSSAENNRYKHALNESTVANLSKTTMHLKEILSILEKKAALKANETAAAAAAIQSYPQQPQQQPTSTPSPTTTPSPYPPSAFLSSHYNSPSAALQSALSSNEYLASELSSLKSPYRFESGSSLPSLSSSSLSLSPSSYSSLTADAYPGFGSSFGGSNQYAALAAAASSGKHLPSFPVAGHHQRKRRPVNRNLRYNYMLAQKQHHGLSASPSLLHAATLAGKNPFLNSAYYSLHNPYWYNRGGQSATSSYPYKNLSKANLHSSLLSGPVSSKLAAAAASSGNYYSDEARPIHPLTNYDPIASVASSLRPSTTMRLRSKPFVFQPHVLPIYTRHTILTQPLDVKK